MNKQLFSAQFITNISQKLITIYGNEFKEEFTDQLLALIDQYHHRISAKHSRLDQKTVYLICYGDSIYEDATPSLTTLHKFANNYLRNTISDIHLLPMFESTSDDGFSVVNYLQIDKNLGNWQNIRELSQDFRLMFDFVANHISQSSRWFQNYLTGNSEYQSYFISQSADFDYSLVVRPRTSPLFHEYATPRGLKSAWTTFSQDQIDLNLRHFPVLYELSTVLLEYIALGATSIRLDAIGFLWKESHSSCMHLPQTHAIIQLWRLIIDELAPNIQIITETNVPHQENISYFGTGNNEAHQVYQFALPPLVLYSFTVHNVEKLTAWAQTITTPGNNACFFNFLASHDGIGMRPVENILTQQEQQLLVDKVLASGGQVSYKTNNDGSHSIYELNINYAMALINPSEEDLGLQIKKNLAAHALLLSLSGVPAIYYHSLLGSENDYEGYQESKINRRINRQKLEYTKLQQELVDNLRRKKTFAGFKQLINIRREQPAFSPYGQQRILQLHPQIFALERFLADNSARITVLINTSPKPQLVNLSIGGVDLITKQLVTTQYLLAPYQYCWIKDEQLS